MKKIICSNCGRVFTLSKKDDDIIKSSANDKTLYINYKHFLCIDCMENKYFNTSILENRIILGLECDKQNDDNKKN